MKRKIIIISSFVVLFALITIILLIPKKVDNMPPNENGIYVLDGYYFEKFDVLKETEVEKLANKINSLKAELFPDSNVYCSIIPDKTYFAPKSDVSTIDYSKMVSLLQENLKDVSYIEISDLLELNDFYKTDMHWRQESLFYIANRLGESLNFDVSKDNFTFNTIKNYCGTYSDLINLDGVTEDFSYLTNVDTENAIVDNYEKPSFKKVYDTQQLNTKKAYDVFLSGATPLITITNPNKETVRELIIFRDSFASSLVPLLIGEYSKITLIDLRYVRSDLITEFVEFGSSDVLFLYSSRLANSSTMLK